MSVDERLVFVDLETGGLELTRPIIQIAAIAIGANGRELESLEMKIRFDESAADPRSLSANKYTRAAWEKEGIEAKDAATRLGAMFRRHATVGLISKNERTYHVAQIVAHNGNFDGPFLRAWYDRQRMFLPASYRVLCTLQRAQWLFHEDKTLTPPADFKLGTLCQYFGVKLRKEESHDALCDVRATVQLYQAMSRHMLPSTVRRVA